MAEESWQWSGPDGLRLSGRIHRREGNGHSPVVLLHGLASNLTRWSEFVRETSLVGTHTVLRVDLRGHGGSATLGPIGLDLWVRDLVAALDALGARQGHWVGHSLGAQVAMHLAREYPQRVASLALIDPVYRQTLRGANLRRAQAGPLFSAAAAVLRAGYRLGWHRRVLQPLDLEVMDREARRALTSPQAEAAFIRQYSSAWADLKSFRTAHYLQELAEMARSAPAPASLPMPTLVMLSTGATFARLADSQAVAREYPQGRIETVDCHHWPVTEKPHEVRRMIESWVLEHTGADPTWPGHRRPDAQRP